MDENFFYKYRVLNEHSLKILTHNEIYLPSPSEFNDPFDCKIPVMIEGSGDFYEREMIQFFQKNMPALTEAQIKELANYVGKFGNPLLMKQAAELFAKAVSTTIGVYCMSIKKDDILMWSHYANSHKGLCFEFKKDYFFKNAKKVKYQSSYPIIKYFGRENYEWVNTLMLTKSEQWCYEKEWRIIEMKGPGLYKFPDHELNGVILGCQMDENTKKIIKSLLEKRKHPVRLYEARVKEKEFGLDIVSF